MRVALSALLSMTLLAGTAAAEPELRLSLPLECEPGKTCFLQHYVDIDPGQGVRDFRCGSATYDGHKGTDFRLLSTAAARRGVRVLAAAPGVVKGMRDGMADTIARENGGKAGVTGKECGNGVVVDHGDGWETQYCHMRSGSLRVKRGERIARGQVLGDVGWSGLADFAHLHLSVRKDGKVVDPFSGHGQDNACSRGGGTGLWENSAVAGFPYANGALLQAGFAEKRFSSYEIERDHEVAEPGPESPAIVLFARFMNLQKGDRVRIRMAGPEGFRFDGTGAPLDRNKQIELMFAVRERKASRWPAGPYEGHVALIRNGAAIIERSLTHTLP